MKQFEVKRKQIEYLAKAFEIALFLLIKKKLGLEGSGVFLIPLMIFILTWTFFGECLSDVLARLIRVRRNKGQYKSIRNIRWYAFLCQFVMGLVGSLLMLSVGTFLGEKVFGCPYASLMIWVLSPLVFLRGISALLLGYCQGEGFELPAVVTCILRLIVIYGFGVVLGGVSGEYGKKVSALLKGDKFTAMYVGEGWCLAMTMAELVIILFLIFSFLGTRGKKKKDGYESVKDSVNLRAYAGAAFGNVFFRELVIFLEIFPIVIGMMIYYKKEGAAAPMTYGTFFVGYMSICLIILRLMNSIAVPYWGKVAGYFKQDEMRLGRVCFQGGIHLIVSLSMILTAGIAAMPSQVGALAGFTSPNMMKVVLQGSALIPFAALEFYFSRMLMRFKKNLIVVGLGILSAILFVMLFSMMWSEEKLGLLALTYAGLISTFVYAVLLGAICIQLMGARINWFKTIVLPSFLAIAIGILQALCVKFVGDKLESLYVVILVGGVGFIAYWCVLIYLKNYSEEELSVIPFGNVILQFGKLLGVF